MPAVILKGDDFVGITDPKRRAIYEAEAAAAAMGILPDDPEKRKLIIERLSARLARAGRGWDFSQQETVVRVDERGVARIIPKSQAVGWMSGLPASPDASDASQSRVVGRTRPLREQVAFSDPGAILPVSARTAAQNFYFRIRDAIERYGTIPQALVLELQAEGWKLGQPVPLAKVEEWAIKFVGESNKRLGAR